ncbi:kinase-like domain-containing protein [Lenzites betulinus]|nr:kinase-like domain-containing protein [Lenzites betulinus]
MPNVIQYIPDLTLKAVDNGRYQVLNLLGVGSFGAVYRARERLPECGRYVLRALKVIPDNKVNRKRHMREVRLHGNIPRHPNVVTLHRAFREGKLLFIVLDLLTGGDLQSHISRKHTLCRNDDLIKAVFLQIVDGVEASHAAGIYHRDLKPENIIVDERFGRVCVADFGLATSADSSTAFNTGTRHYMSPECVDCGDYLYPYSTSRSDIWALGVILLNMVTGHRPWDKATLEDDQFLSFLEEEEWLRDVFPISKGLNDILRNIFTIIPSAALTLPEIRREIRNLDTFYMSEQEVKASSPDVRYMWKWYAPRPTESVSASAASSTDSEGGFDSWTSSESSESSESGSSQSRPYAPGTQLLAFAEEGRLILPRSLGATQPASFVLHVQQTASSDEFPIRRPATRRALLLHPGPSNSTSSARPSTQSSGNSPVTPETHSRDLPETLVAEAIEPLMLEGPILCHGKDSIRQKRMNAIEPAIGRSILSSQSM